MASWDALAFIPLIVLAFARGLDLVSLCNTGDVYAFGILVLLGATLVTRGFCRVGLVACLLGLMKQRMDGEMFNFSSDADLSGHVVVITGANSGIGLALAREMHGLNATVVMACRSLAKCEAVAPKGAECMVLDMADLQSVTRFASELASRHTRIDYLVNNAGMVASKGERTAQGYETMLGVMHLGHFLLTRLLLPLIQTPHPDGFPARIVNHASAAMMGGTVDWLENDAEHDLRGEVSNGCPFTFGEVLATRTLCPMTGSYSRAKLAQVLFTQELQQRLDASNHSREVVVSTLHPGEVQSGILEVSDVLVRPTLQGARVLLYCLLAEFPRGSYVDEMQVPHDLQLTSSFSNLRGMWSLPIWSYQRAVRGDAEKWRSKLWSISEREIGKHVKLPPAPEGWNLKQ